MIVREAKEARVSQTMSSRHSHACASSPPKRPLRFGTEALRHDDDFFLEYAPSGGFNNQRRNLLHGLMIAYTLNRTLLVAPPFSHADGPKYGSCPGHVRSPETLQASFVSAAVKSERDAAAKARKYYNRRSRHEKAPPGASSLHRILSLNATRHLGVRTRDWTAEVVLPSSSSRDGGGGGGEDASSSSKQRVASSAFSLYDCTNTIWSFEDRIKRPCGSPEYGARGGCKCLSLRETLPKDVALLRFGSTFKGIDMRSFDRAFKKVASQEPFLRASVEYAEPFNLLASRVMPGSSNENALVGDYAAFHVRGGDGDFSRRVDSTLSRGFRELARQLREHNETTLPLFVATDLSQSALKAKASFKRGLASLVALTPSLEHVRVLTRRDLLPPKTSASQALYEAALEVWGSQQDAAFLAAAPELEMHLDVVLCASARLAYVGTSGSSMSSTIRNLRKFRIKDAAAAKKKLLVH